MFQQVCPPDAKMGSYYSHNDGLADGDSNQLPLQSLPVVGSAFENSASAYNLPDVPYANGNSVDINGSCEYQTNTQLGSGGESNFTRLSLFWGSFSLLMFNPFVISTSGDADRGGAHCKFV